jgi:hypothetical protein
MRRHSNDDFDSMFNSMADTISKAQRRAKRIFLILGLISVSALLGCFWALFMGNLSMSATVGACLGILISAPLSWVSLATVLASSIKA